jgi:hypothetical protein
MNSKLQTYLQNKKVLFGSAGVLLLIVPLLFFSLHPTGSTTNAPGADLETASSGSGSEIHGIRPTSQPVSATLYLQKQSTDSASVRVDTGNRSVSAIQLAISFDPLILRNISIKPGNFFSQALILINRIDYSTGTIFYAAVVPPTAKPQQGKGVVAWVNYDFAQGAINPTTLQFLPNTKVASRGVDDSILKNSSGLTVAPDYAWKQ